MKKNLVCINDNWNGRRITPEQPWPIKGEIYIFDGLKYGSPFIYLRGYDWLTNDKTRIGFASSYFREVDSSFGQYCEDIYLSIAQFEEAMKEAVI